MDKIKVIHDTVGHTLTVWLDDPHLEYVCDEIADEVVIMKDASNRIIGVEILHYRPERAEAGLSIEAIVQTVAHNEEAAASA